MKQSAVLFDNFLTVPDYEAAVKWYSEQLENQPISLPINAFWIEILAGRKLSKPIEYERMSENLKGMSPIRIPKN